MTRSFWLRIVVLLVGLLAGCRSASPTKTGAREAVESFAEAVLKQDWQTVYAGLDAESRTKDPLAQFGPLAAQWRKELKLTPETFRVRYCEEHGKDAVAHVIFQGRAGPVQRAQKIVVKLRKGDAGWEVLWPPELR